MNRDMELVREILLKLEEREPAKPKLGYDLAVQGYTQDEVFYHIKLLSQAGLINEKDASIPILRVPVEVDLTWQGHEFLDAVRSETVWNQTKEVVKEKGGSVTFDILKALAIQIAAKHFGL